MKTSKYWSEQFNALPDETRHIACAVSGYDSIRYLEREKLRLKTRYNESLKEINAHIKSHEHWIAKEFT